ncbi:MAG TPA: LptF/LptG family permease [Pirellulales bacterium]|nr:LptF/LptG family permease [Pirellulales bacterium]
MRLLTRYVLAELLKIFLVALSALTMLMLVYGLVKQARDQGLGPEQVVRLIPYILPEMLRYTIPATLLFAASSVYGRMAGSNEVVAIKSLGISPMTVLWPCYILATLLSLLTVWLNDVAITWGQAGIQQVVIEGVEEIIYGMLRTQRAYTNKSLTILVKGVEGKRLIQPTFTFASTPDQPPKTITAREAQIRCDGEMLTIVFRHATIETQGRQGDFSSAFLDHFEYERPVLDMSRQTDDSHVPTRVPIRLINREVAAVETEMATYQRRQAGQMALAMATGDFDYLATKDWGHEALVLQDFRNHLYRLFTEPPRRMSAGFSCLCFVLVGAPMAIWRRNADFLTSFFLCFLPILLIYYPLLVFGVEQAKSGTCEPHIVWLGNAVLTVWGLWMLRAKVLRH